MVGSWFYMGSKRDFEMGSAYQMFYSRKLRKLQEKHKFDTEKIAFLERYIQELSEQSGVLKRSN